MDENNRAKFIKMNDDENTEIRTEPFYFDHAELSPTPVHTTTSDVYGRNLEKVYDKVFVYDSKTTRPYYIWTQFRNGQTVVNRLNKSYSGKWDIRQAARRMAAEGGENIEDYLVTAGIPDPDLLIRTSGEKRISNYMLWQLAYTEFVFTDTLWPDFRKEQYLCALQEYASRDRRFGKVK